MQCGTRMLLYLLLVFSLLAAGCSSSQPVSQTTGVSGEKAASGQVAHDDKKNSNTEKVEYTKITVYRATLDAMYLVPEVHQVPRSEASAKTALELLISAPTRKDVMSPVPAGTVVRNFSIKNHIAYVDFNEKIVKNNIGGSASELLLIGAIVNTLTEFPEIEKVQILVNGAVIETIAGHVDVSEPLSRSPSIIKNK